MNKSLIDCRVEFEYLNELGDKKFGVHCAATIPAVPRNYNKR